MQFLGKYRNWLTLIILGLGILWIFISRTTTQNTSAEAISQPYKGFLAPDFELTTSNGEIIRLSELRGKAIILNFWASWCPPCRAEMPAIEAVHKSYQEKGLVVLGINATNQDQVTQVNAYTDNMGLTFQILFDTSGITQELYAVSALPSTFFIDREGIIREVIIGGPMAEALLKIHTDTILTEGE